MLQTTYYDISRFKSEQHAIDSKEVYRVRQMGKTLIVTDPNGKEEYRNLIFSDTRRGLHLVDRKPLNAWLGNDMAKREMNNKNKKNVTKKIQKAGQKTSA
jgi:hypothetical protein